MSNPEEYTVGWICALMTEYTAAQAFLDETHEAPEPVSPTDNNIYTVGRMGIHKIVVAVWPGAWYGGYPAARVATDMLRSFPNIKIGLMVGIGGGVPSQKHDIRLGDIVVGVGWGGKSGVCQYDLKESKEGQDFLMTGSLNQPQAFLRSAISTLQSVYERKGHTWIEESIQSILEEKSGLRKIYQRPHSDSDRLYRSEIACVHPRDDRTCSVTCGDDASHLVAREERSEEDIPAIHYGLIASSDLVIKDALIRDRIGAEQDVLCFEMEAAGLMNDFPCLVIRGICDYSDSHKNNEWQGYAAIVATAYAKDLLRMIPSSRMDAEKRLVDFISDGQNVKDDHRDLAQKQLDLQPSLVKRQLTERQAECLQLFRSTTDVTDTTYEWHKNRVERRVEGTCEWFLHHENFRRWLEQDSGTLLVSADAGCGKSVLARYLVDTILPRSSTICYFFFKDGDQDTVRQAFCALLHQLFSQKPFLIEHAMESFKMNGPKLIESTVQLWAILERATKNPQAGAVIIVLDALDECAESEVEGLMQILRRQIHNFQTDRGRLKFLLTSRPYDQISETFIEKQNGFSFIRIPGEDVSETISREISHAVQYRVEHLAREKGLPEPVKTHLSRRLSEVGYRTYQWVYLIFNFLHREGFEETIEGIDSALTTFRQPEYETQKNLRQQVPKRSLTSSFFGSGPDGHSTRIFSHSGTSTNVLTENTSIVDGSQATEVFDEGTGEQNTKAHKEMFDSQTQYSASDTSSLSPLPDMEYITALGSELIDTVESLHPSQEALKYIATVLPDLLKAFALKLGYKAGTKMHLDVSFFVHKNRSYIQAFFEKVFSLEMDTERVSKDNEAGQFAIERFLMDGCEVPQAYLEALPTPTDLHLEGEEYDDVEPESDTGPYRDFVLGTPAYAWLIETLRREATLTRGTPDIMGEIRKGILQALPPVGRVSRKRPSQEYRGVFEFDWDPLSFVMEQQSTEPPHEALRKAITLTGTASDGQAMITGAYLSQTWPATGDVVMHLVEEVVKHPEHHSTECFQDGTEVYAKIQEGKFVVTVSGTGESLAEVAEQFAWLGSALRPSHVEDGVVSCTPIIQSAHPQSLSPSSATSTSEIFFMVGFIMERHVTGENSPGECWHKMFRNPVIVSGFPILSKRSHGLGLEMPLNMMAGLTGTDKAIEFDGKVFIKGFSAMLVAVKMMEGLLVWHYFFNPGGHRVSYLDHSLRDLDRVSLVQLETCRHVIGWCLDCMYNAGAEDSFYNTTKTGLPRPHAGCVLDKVSLSGGKIITGGLSFSIFVRDTPPHIVRSGYIPRLKWISTKYVVLWDERDKRGWLVNGTSALLHLVRASLHHYSKDDFASSFLFKFDELKNSSGRRPNSAIEVLIHGENKELEIYPGKSERSEEEEITPGARESPNSKTRKKRQGYYLFEDLVDQHFTMLEQIMEYHSHASGENGVNLKARVRKHLEGWDFVELATDYDPRPRVATLEAMGWGWVDFIRSIGAISLFGRGFGEIIKPVEFDQMCPGWKTLPTQKYYLAASVRDVEKIMERFGNGWESPEKSIHNLVWHCPVSPIAPCVCQSPRGRKRLSQKPMRHHDPVQVFCPKSSRLISRIQGPGKLESNGAVVFGHNFSCKLRWRNNGQQDLEQGDPPLPASSPQNSSMTSSLDSNLSTQATHRSPESGNSHSHHSPASWTATSSTSTDPKYSTPATSTTDMTQDIANSDTSHSTLPERAKSGIRTLRHEKRRLQK